MPTCSFCKKHYREPRGLTLFTFEGKTIHFCSSKCKRNLDLKRDPKKVSWIKKGKMTRAEKLAEVKAELQEEKAEEEAEKVEKKSEKEKPKEAKEEKK